jgi:hypothetical protein
MNLVPKFSKNITYLLLLYLNMIYFKNKNNYKEIITRNIKH